MIRSFLPVGQGAFFTEQFSSGMNVVYDCGSSTDVRIVNEEIEHTFNKGEVISAVFISHLHDDHVNGLEFLLKHCRVKKLYLPYLTPEEIRLERLIQVVEHPKASEFVKGLLTDAVATLRENTHNTEPPQVIFVHPPEDETIGARDGGQIRSGQDVFPETAHSDWVYIPYNFKNRERTELFRKILDKEGLYEILESNLFEENIRENIKALKKVYGKVPDGLNTNSLVVYSGPKENKGFQWECISRFKHPGCWYEPIGAGCIYTGDYNANGDENWNEFCAAYRSCFKKTGIIQVPHHGSNNNYNTKICGIAEALIICAGYSNRYRHPHGAVLRDMIAQHIPFYWVTEQRGSAVFFEIRGY